MSDLAEPDYAAKRLRSESIETGFKDYTEKLHDLCTKIGLPSSVVCSTRLKPQRPRGVYAEVTVKLGPFFGIGYGSSASEAESVASRRILIEMNKIASGYDFGVIVTPKAMLNTLCAKIGLEFIIPRNAIRTDFPAAYQFETEMQSGQLFSICHGDSEAYSEREAVLDFLRVLKAEIKAAQ